MILEALRNTRVPGSERHIKTGCDFYFMEHARHSHILKWYFMYSIFALFIIIGVFSIMNSYTMAMKEHFAPITFRTIEDISNIGAQTSETPTFSSNAGYFFLVSLGIVGFLFTKYLYEKQKRGV